MKRRLLTLVFACSVAGSVAAMRAATPTTTDSVQASHLLNRLGFGARPGDVARVQRIGAEAYIEEQLHPERLDDSSLAEHLADFETLRMSSAEIAERFEPRQRQQSSDVTPRQGAQPILELSQQKILRAIYSEHQLEEVLVDFWFNYFNVDARKGPTRFLLTAYERDAIRPHVLDSFRSLLGATAKSPAMLFYLDNWQSVSTDGMRAGRIEARRRGLNENYARELLELHTLGVDGGYTQQDVSEVARAFTGWSIDGPRQGGDFRFMPRLHDQRGMTVLGRRIDAGGEGDGEAVLDLLAAHPSTARHVAYRLAVRFVSDEPPAALVARVADEFRRSHGNLRSVMRTLLTSPEFLSPQNVGTKIKTPFDFVVSALRATDAHVREARPLVRVFQELGMPLYQCQPPTGYRDTADAWVNTGALVARMNVALSLAEGRTPGTRLSTAVDPTSVVGPRVSDSTRATISRAATPAQGIALALGSPEFQRR